MLGEGVDAGLHRGRQPLPGLDTGGGEFRGVEDRPVGAADLLLGAGGDFGQCCGTGGSGSAGAATGSAPTPRYTGLVVLVNTAPVAGPGSAMPAASRVNVSVLIGRGQAGLAAAARAISDPGSPRYQHYLSAAQVAAEFGATSAQQAAVSGWLSKSGLTVTHRDGFAVDASGTVARAQAALHARLGLYRPSGGTEQVVADKAMSVPAAIAGSVSTIRVSQATVAMTPHERLAPVQAHPQPLTKAREKCSAYYGQKKATNLPGAYGRTLTWAPCGYLPQQLRGAYGATRSGLTGAGAGVAILSEDNDKTILSDANRWARDRDFPPFKPGQFSTNIAATGVPTAPATWRARSTWSPCTGWPRRRGSPTSSATARSPVTGCSTHWTRSSPTTSPTW